METGLLIFALVMACGAGASVIWGVVTETSEAWSISHLGWRDGHRTHHLASHGR